MKTLILLVSIFFSLSANASFVDDLVGAAVDGFVDGLTSDNNLTEEEKRKVQNALFFKEKMPKYKELTPITLESIDLLFSHPNDYDYQRIIVSGVKISDVEDDNNHVFYKRTNNPEKSITLILNKDENEFIVMRKGEIKQTIKKGDVIKIDCMIDMKQVNSTVYGMCRKAKTEITGKFSPNVMPFDEKRRMPSEVKTKIVKNHYLEKDDGIKKFKPLKDPHLSGKSNAEVLKKHNHDDSHLFSGMEELTSVYIMYNGFTVMCIDTNATFSSDASEYKESVKKTLNSILIGNNAPEKKWNSLKDSAYDKALQSKTYTLAKTLYGGRNLSNNYQMIAECDNNKSTHEYTMNLIRMKYDGVQKRERDL